MTVMVAPRAGHRGFAGAMLWCKGFRGSLASHRAHSSFGELCSTQESTWCLCSPTLLLLCPQPFQLNGASSIPVFFGQDKSLCRKMLPWSFFTVWCWHALTSADFSPVLDTEVALKLGI